MTLISVIASLTFLMMPSGATLYNSELEPTVRLPAGYFCLKQDAPSPDGFISVSYGDLVGLVKASEVQAVDYTPVTKYETTVTFRCDNDGQPVNLRTAPRKTAEIAAVLDNGTSGRCYGSIDGEQLIADAGKTWYYVSVGNIRGYCYYAHVNVDPTPPNVIEKEEEPDSTTGTEPEPEKKPKAMSKTAAIILIVALCVPVPFIMFYLFRKPKGEK